MCTLRQFLGSLLLVLPISIQALAWQDSPPPPQVQYLQGLAQRPYAVAVTPDGRTILAGSTDGTIGVWDRLTGEPVRIFRAAPSAVLGLSVARGGNIYAAVGVDGPVRLFDLPRRHPLAELTGIPNDPTSVAISPDGRIGVTGDSARVVRIWDLAAKKSIRDLPGHTAAITGVAFVAPTRTVLATAANGFLRGWLYTNGEARGEVQTVPIAAVAASADGRLVALTGDDGLVRLLRWPPVPQRKLVQHTGNVAGVATTPDGKVVVSGSENQQLQIFDGATGKSLKSLSGQQGTTTAVDVHPGGSLVVTGNSTGSWQAWRVVDGKAQPGRGGHQQAIRAIAVSPAAEPQLATAGADGTVRTWTPAKPPISLAGHKMSLTSIALSTDGKTLATGSADKTLRTWSTANAKPGRDLPAAAQPIHSVAVAADGSLLARGDSTGTLQLQAGNAEPRSLGAHTGAVTSIAIHPDGKQIITSGADGRVRTWTPRPIPRAAFPAHPGAISVVARSADGKRLATGSSDGRVRLIASTGGVVVRTLAGLKGTITSVAFSANTATVAAGNNQGKVRLWNVADGALLGELAVHAGNVTGVALHPDGKRLITAGADGTWKLWTLPLPKPGVKSETKPALMTTAHAGGVTAIRLTTDGAQLLTGGADKLVKLFTLAGKLLRSYPGHTAAVRSVDLSTDRVIAGGDDKTVRSWIRANGTVGPVTTLPGRVHGLAIDAGGQRAAAAVENGTVRIIDLAGGNQLEWFAGHKGIVRTVTWTGPHTLVSGGDDKTLRAGVVSARSVHAADPTAVHDLVLFPDGTQYFTGGTDRKLKQWTLAGKPVKTLATLSAPIRHVSISPDGKTVAAGGDPLASSKEVRAFRVADGKQLFAAAMPAGVTALTLAGNNRLAVTDSGKAIHWFQASDGRLLETTITAAVATDLAAHGDGRTLYLASADNNVWIIQAALDHLLVGHQGAVTGVGWTADGRWLLTSGADKTVRQWNLQTGKGTRQYTGSTQPLTSLAVSADGKRLAAAAGDNRILGWPIRADAATAAIANDLAIAAKTAIADLAINGDGSIVVSTGSDNFLSLWDTSTGKLRERLAGHSSVIRSVAITADGRRVLSGANDRIAFLWQPSVSSTWLAHKGPARAVVFSPDGGHLLTAGDDRRISRWAVPGGQPVNEYAGAGGPIRGLAISGDGRVVAAGGDDKVLRTWTVADAAALAQTTLATAITGVALDSTGQTVITSGDLVVRQFDIAASGGKTQLVPQQQGHGHTKTTTAIALAANNRGLVSVGLDRTLRHWYSARSPARTTLSGHTGPVYGSSFSPDGKLLATAGSDRTVRLWNLETGEAAGSFEGHTHQVTGVAFNPTVKQLASTSLDGTLRIWPLGGDAEVQVFREGVEGGLLDVAITPNGNGISVVGRDRRWRLLSRTTLKPARDMPGHANPIYSVAFNGSGNRAVTLDRSGKFFLWDTSNGNIRFHQQLPVTRTTSIAFAPDGSEVFVAGAEKRVLKVVIPTAVR